MLHKSGLETAADRKRRQVDCRICCVSVQAGSFQGHLEMRHDVYRSIVLNRDIVKERLAVVYRAITLPLTDRYFCPVANCVGKASTWWNLCRHFLEHHPQDLVVCPSEGAAPFPKCLRCGMQTAPGALMHKHQETAYGLLLLPGGKLCWQGKHMVESMPALLGESPSGSCCLSK
jgi:hypothetical protein